MRAVSTEKKSSAIRYIEPAQLRVWRPAEAVHLRAEIREDRTILSAVVKRAFPLSNEDKFLSLQEADGVEVGVLKSLEGIDDASRRVIMEEFDRRYYTPKIQRILSLIQDAGMWKFDVETQRGPKLFYVRNWRDSAFEMTPGRWQILSVDGGRYEIVDLTRLDAGSQKALELLL